MKILSLFLICVAVAMGNQVPDSIIREYQSQIISLIGTVTKPGTCQLVGRMTLPDIISQAGGFKDDASNEIFVLREGRQANAATIRIDLEDLTVNGNQKLNIPLQAGDVINIPIDEMISIFVFGAVSMRCL